MIFPPHVVLDSTAMLAIGRGGRVASRLVQQAGLVGGPALYAPTCAVVEAERVRRGVAEHLASLPGVEFLPLDLAAALSVARSRHWADAHSHYAARPMPGRPSAAVVATTDPERWAGAHVELVHLAP